MNDHVLPGIGRYAITFKLPRHNEHDPRNKQTGGCAASPECTDATGQHHTVVVETDRLQEVLGRYEHVTRVERVTSIERYVPDATYQILCGLSGSELLLRSDLHQAALDAYSVVFEPSRKLTMDHQKAVKAAVAAALLRVAQEAQELHEKASCSCGDNMPEGVRCPSCTDGPDEVALWLRATALRLDPEVQQRDRDFL
jgi:hypothetical protein